MTTAILVAASIGGAALAGGHSAETEAVVMDHLRAFGQLDAAAMTAPYADDAKIVTADRIYSGTAEIREFMDELVAEFSGPDISMETLSMVFEGDVAFMTWKAESPDNLYEFGADTFVVVDGKIVTQTSGVSISPKQ